MFSWLLKNEVGAETIAVQSSMRRGAFERDSVERFQLLVPHLLRCLRGARPIDLPGGIPRCTPADNPCSARGRRLPACFRESSGDVRLDGGNTASIQWVWRASQFLICGTTGRAPEVEQGHRPRSGVQHYVAGDVHDRDKGATTTAPQPDCPCRYVAANTSTMSRHTAAMVLASDPLFDSPPPLSLIADALGLTPSEAALASALCSGVSLRAVSVRLNRSVNTCKAQLKSIYAKTSCRSHVDLVRLLVAATMARPKNRES